MFIIKYALKSIIRSVGRNILIALIVLIIATAACVAMSIQQAAQKAAENSLKGMSIAGEVNIDKGYLLEVAKAKYGDKDIRSLQPEMNALMKEYSLSLEDMEDFASVKNDAGETLVKTYYYNAAISINGNDDFEKYDPQNSSGSESATEAATEAPTEAPAMVKPTINTYDANGNPIVMEIDIPEMTQAANENEGPPGNEQQMEKKGDFNLLGYNSYDALKEVEKFGDDSSSSFMKKQGEFFADNTTEYECMIEEALLDYNGVKVGDTITLTNPNVEDETYEMKIVGTFKSNKGITSSGADAYNTILTSYNVVKDIETKSEATNESTSSDSSSDSEEENNNALVSQFTGEFIFADVDLYNVFKAEVESIEPEDTEVDTDSNMYIVTSNDVASFEEGLKPLENLKTFATYFLYLMLGIGAIVLIVISVISIRDRKYEIGVLAAMGIKKFKLSMMFMIEVLTITLIAIIIGAAVGSAVSVPVTNSLLSSQVDETIKETEDKQQSIQQGGMDQGSQEKPKNGEVHGKVEYTREVGFSVDFIVILKMLGIGVVLAVVSGFTSILFILRYDPKQILANRD